MYLKKILKIITILSPALFLNQAFSYSCDQIIKKKGYEICYNYKLKEALWSKAYLRHSDLKKKGYSRKGVRFYPEISIPKKYRSALSDYKHSGWDRGHLISNDDLNHNRSMQKETFSLANIHPQAPKLNRGVYKQAEKATRRLIIKSHKNGVIVAGGFFKKINPKRLGPHRIAIPYKIYRIVIIDNGNTYAYLFPNKKNFKYGRLKQYRVPISLIEKETGFHFKR